MKLSIYLLSSLLLLAPEAIAQTITNTNGKPDRMIEIDTDRGLAEDGLENLETFEYLEEAYRNLKPADLSNRAGRRAAVADYALSQELSSLTVINIALTGQANPSAYKQLELQNWIDEELNPPLLDNSVHLRSGVASHGEFGGSVTGRPSCDFLYLVYAKTKKDFSTDPQYEYCVLLERSFFVSGGKSPGLRDVVKLAGHSDGLNISTPQGKAEAMARYAPIVDKKLRLFASSNSFYFRPNRSSQWAATHYNPETQVLTAAIRLTPGSGLSEVSGPEFELNRPARPEIKPSGAPMFIVQGRVSPEVGKEFLDKAFSAGRDNAMDRIVFHVIGVEDKGPVKKLQVKIDTMELGWRRLGTGDPMSQHERKLYQVIRFYNSGQ